MCCDMPPVARYFSVIKKIDKVFERSTWIAFLIFSPAWFIGLHLVHATFKNNVFAKKIIQMQL